MINKTRNGTKFFSEQGARTGRAGKALSPLTSLLALGLGLGIGASATAQELSFDLTAAAEDPTEAEASTDLIRRDLQWLDEHYNMKGLNLPVPPFADSILKDKGGLRSKLSKYGFGFVATSMNIAAQNLLNGPRRGPGPLLEDGSYSDQQYWGQRASGLSTNTFYLNYDTSRWGVPNGQISGSVIKSFSSWDAYSPEAFSLVGLSWYQTFLDEKLELKFGYLQSSLEWIGLSTGGNTANPLGSATAIPYELGMSTSPSPAPGIWAKYHFNDEYYNQIGVFRSLPINGPTGNPIYDSTILNPDGLSFNIENGKALVMNEFGYKRPATPGRGQKWIRGGLMYNDSDFPNFRDGGTQQGSWGAYLVGDWQVSQFAPGSPATAYKGLYLGASAMFGDEKSLAFSDYYELRAYVVGPFESRPADQAALVVTNSGISPFLVDNVNSASDLTGVYANSDTSSVVGSYTARITDGAYATFGLSYTDNPTLTYQKGDKSSLNFMTALFVNF